MKNLKITALLAGFLTGVLGYWLNEYNVMHVYGIHIYVILVAGAFLSALLLAGTASGMSIKSATSIYIGVILAVVGRIAYDLMNDSTSHNLFPFEILFVSLAVIPAIGIGAFLSGLIKKRK